MTKVRSRRAKKSAPQPQGASAVVCPSCAVRGRPGLSWAPTGRLNWKPGRWGYFRRAGLKCLDCGYAWSSGFPAALEAGLKAAPPSEVTPYPTELRVEPRPMAQRRAGPGFVHAGTLVAGAADALQRIRS